MTLSSQSEESAPPVPTKDPGIDAPPVYQPSPNGPSSNEGTNFSTSGSGSGTNDSTTGIAVTAQSPLAANTLSPSPVSRRAGPLHSPPSPNDVSIPFYSNPPPTADHLVHQPDRKDPTSLPTTDNGHGNTAGQSRSNGKPSAFACLTLHSNDKIGSANLSAAVTNDLDGVIRAKWTKGIQKWAYEDGGWCWQLNGKPCTSAHTRT